MKRTTLLFLLLITSFFSCRKTQSASPDRIVPIDGGVGIKVQELLSATYTDRHLQFFCLTDKSYDCGNDSLVYTCSKANNIVNIKFLSVFEPGFCFDANGNSTSQGIAGTVIDLGYFDAGIYSVNITNGDILYPCTLRVDSQKFSLTGLPNTLDTLVWRVPKNVIWGYLGTDSSSKSALISDFIDSLLSYGAQPVPLIPDKDFAYSYYYYDSVYSASAYTFNRTFVYKFSGDFSAVQNLAAHFEQISDSLMAFDIQNDRAQECAIYLHQP